MFRFTPTQSAYLDAWRGGAALIVLVGHSFQIYSLNPHPVWGALAAAAVMAFFALSGFLIGKSTQSGDWRKFTVARANRILPPFLFSLALVSVLYWVAPFAFVTGTHALPEATARPSYSLEGLLPTLFLMNGFVGQTVSANGPLWSLTFEVWYYAIAAFAVFGRRPAALAFALILTVLEPSFAILGSVWFLGYLLAWGVRLPIGRPLWAAPALAMVAIFVAPENYVGYLTLIFEVLFGVCFVGHIARVLDGDPIRIPLLSYTAKFSYTLYVTHFPLLLFGYGMGQSWAASAIVALAFAAFIGTYLEKLRPIPVMRATRDSTTT